MGIISTSWPTDKNPSIKVPVTTVPNPLIEKALSIGNLGLLKSFLAVVLSKAESIESIRFEIPEPVVAETDITSAPSSVVPVSNSPTSA